MVVLCIKALEPECIRHICRRKPTSDTSAAACLFQALWSLPCSLRQGHASELTSGHVVGLG